MSTDNVAPHEEVPSSLPTPSEATPETPVAEATPAVPETSTEESQRKLQLRPTVAPGEGKAIASLGTPAGAPPVAAIPAQDDADVDAEVQRAVKAAAAAASAPPPPPTTPVAIPEQEAIDAGLEADIEAAMAQASAAATPAAPVEGDAPVAVIDIETLQPGQKLRGTVLVVQEDSVFLDFNLPMTGVVPFRQFDAKNQPQVGGVVEVVFDRIDETEGLILTNLARGTAKIKGGDWSAVSPDQIVECVVTKTNKGGLEVNVGTLRGFIPASQVELGFVADLATYVGQKLRAKITEVNPAKRKLVLTRRALLAEERELAKADLLNEIKPDQVRTGRVKTIKEFGAFIDLGGMDGFLPVAQMSWVRIEHPNEVLTEGQQVEVKVLSIDREKNRISLGMRQLSPNPWRTAETKYEKGASVTGRVTRVEAFGAFVELEPGIEGLVHISELEHRRVKRVTEVLNVGDMPEVQILEVDPGKKRISLSVKALKAKPEPVEKPKDEDLAPGKGEKYERRVSNLNLKGGTGGNKGGGLFGNPKDYGN
ncbi:30S ribosomal protein S1 [Planctomicrobium sp. SH664]|uniref:30S ribosomal protein S1 n=1 Tax=Planctomicrobium sp. SH664 TaxID=3448125 RepID=UPI003F5B4D07